MANDEDNASLDLSGYPSKKSRFQAQSPDWSYWANLAVVPCIDACILSCGVEPRHTKLNDVPQSLQDEVRRRLEIAESHLSQGLLACVTPVDRYYDRVASGVTLLEFRRWGESLVHPFQFADGFPRAESPQPPRGRWPWGNYETKLLSELAAAADRFWTRYTPDDPSTAVTSKEVMEWLTARDVPKRVAEVMAQILRADGLKPGPR